MTRPRIAVFKSADDALGGVLADVAQTESFDGKSGQSIIVHTHGKLPAKRVIVRRRRRARRVLECRAIRDLTATVAQTANKAGAAAVGIRAAVARREPRARARRRWPPRASILGTYKFGRYLTGEDHKRATALKTFGLVTDAKGKKPTAAQTKAFTARDHARHRRSRSRDQPRARPDQRARRRRSRRRRSRPRRRRSRRSTRARCPVTVLDAKKCAELGMGMFLAVGQGSDQEPRFIHMTYKPAKKPKKTHLLHRQGRHVRLGRLLAQAVARRWRT